MKIARTMVATAAVVVGCHVTAATAQTSPDVKLSPATASTTSTASTLMPGSPPNEAAHSLGLAAQRPLQEPSGSGLLDGYGQKLQDDGVQIHGVFLDAFSANPNEGAFPNHTVNSGILLPEMDFDLGKLVGLQGSTIHGAYTIYTLKSNTPAGALEYGDMVGAYLGLPIPNSNMLTKLTFEQKAFHNRLDVEVGKMSPVRVFALPNCENIQACISDPVLTIDASEMPFVYSVWGGRVSYNLTDAIYVQGAAFEDDWIDNFHNGLHLGDAGASGVLSVGEVGYKTTYANAAYPTVAEFGGFYNNSPKGSPKGFPLPYVRQLSAYPYDGGKGLFLRVQRVVYRKPGPFVGPFPKNVTLYGAADAAVDGPQPSVFTGWIGVNATGFIPGRPFDTLGMQFTYNKIGSHEVSFEESSRLAAGQGVSTQNSNEFVVAVDSHHQLRPWLGLEFSANYFINPNDFYDELGPRKPRDGFITTANLIVSIGPLLGTSKSPF